MGQWIAVDLAGTQIENLKKIYIVLCKENLFIFWKKFSIYETKKFGGF